MKADISILDGPPIDELVQASAISDLLVLAQPRPGVHLGGAIRGLLAHANSPVVIIPTAGRPYEQRERSSLQDGEVALHDHEEWADLSG